MLGSVVLDVAIGMAFVYLLLSLIASGIQELIASFLQARAANLQRGIRSLLSEDSIDASGDTLAESIYKHGLVRGLYQDMHYDYGEELGKLGILDKFRIWLQNLFGVSPPKAISGIVNPLLLPAYIPARTFALAMIDLLDKNNPPGSNSVEGIESFLRGYLASLETDPNATENKAVEALLALADNAGGSIDAFQTNLENWYNDAMDRVSGWYKKYTQKALIGIGLALAIVFNVDSVSVAKVFWLNQDIRQAMVNAASDYTKNHSDLTSASDKAALENCEKSATEASGSGDADSASSLEKQMKCRVDAFQSVSKTALLPVGWSAATGPHWDKTLKGTALVVGFLKGVGHWIWSWKGVSLVFGWIITAIALSMGAPFWFDTLNKFMVVRSTIKPHEKSQPEGSKD